MNLKEISVKHDYYCSDSNFYSNEPAETYRTFQDFYEEYHDADIDTNLVFRWDLKEEDGKYFMEVFMIQQRKGIFKPIYIKNIVESDADNIVKFLQPHMNKLKRLWKPLK